MEKGFLFHCCDVLWKALCDPAWVRLHVREGRRVVHESRPSHEAFTTPEVHFRSAALP